MATTASRNDSKHPRISLVSLLLMFLKIGSTSFGGFMALISVVQNYIVERRRLLSREQMLDGISLATILPGPVAVNVVAYVGYRLRGGMGAFVSAFAVILPSFLLVLGLSYAYFRWGQMPTVNKFFMGFIPAVAAIIVSAAWGMARKTIKGVAEALIAGAGLILLLWVGGFFVTLVIIVSAGILGWALFRNPDGTAGKRTRASESKPKPGKRRRRRSRRRGHKLRLFSLVAPVAVAPLLSLDFALAAKLLFSFAGMSVLLFGGGFVFIPLIQESVVQGYGWVTQQEFIDGIALGQVTPGPILISATFIGYKVGGLIGATAATVGIFTPPAILMVYASRFLDRARTQPGVAAALRGVHSVVIGLIAAAAYIVATTAPEHWLSLVIFAGTLYGTIRFRIEPAWTILASGLAAYLFY